MVRRSLTEIFADGPPQWFWRLTILAAAGIAVGTYFAGAGPIGACACGAALPAGALIYDLRSKR